MFGELLVRYRKPLLAGVLLLAALSLWQLPRVQVRNEFSRNLASGNEDYDFYQKMIAHLGDEGKFIVAGIRREGGIFDQEFLQKVRAFTFACDTLLPHVEEAQSVLTMDDGFISIFGLMGYPYLVAEKPDRYAPDSAYMVRDERLMNRYVSADFKTLAVILELKKDLTAQQGNELSVQLEALLAKQGFEEAHLAGEIYFESYINRRIKKEVVSTMIFSGGMVVLLLGWLYRSLWGVLIPLTTYLLALILTIGYFAVFQRPYHLFSSLMPQILLVATLSDVTHVLNKYENLLPVSANKWAALRAAFNQTRIPTFLTSFVISLGFCTYATSSIPNIRDFGIDMGVSVMLAYLVTISFLPAVVLFVKPEQFITNDFYRKNWQSFAAGIFGFISKRKKWVPVGVALVVLAGVTGALQLESNNNYLIHGFFREGHPMEKSIEFLEKNLGGVRTLEIATLPGQGHLLSDLRVLREIEKVHDHVASLPGVGGVFSPVSFYKSFHKTMDENHRNYFLPGSQDTLDFEENFIREEADFKFSRILNEEKNWGKIATRMKDSGSREAAKFNSELDGWMAANTDTSLVKFRITGTTFIGDLTHKNGVPGVIYNFITSLLIVAPVLALAFRRRLLVGVTLAVNLTPIFLTVAMMSLLGINLTLGTALTFTIVFVLALDDTIHFVSLYKKQRSEGVSSSEAVQSILAGTGKAMLMTTILVVGAFVPLLFSDFNDGRSWAAMACLTSVFALVMDLFLSPWLLLNLDKRS